MILQIERAQPAGASKAEGGKYISGLIVVIFQNTKYKGETDKLPEVGKRGCPQRNEDNISTRHPISSTTHYKQYLQNSEEKYFNREF